MRIFHNEDIVKCTVASKPLPDNQNTRYRYIVTPADLDEQIHIERAQAALVEYFHDHRHCETTANVEKLVLGVPHRINGTCLEREENTVGFGIYYSISSALTLSAV